MGSLVHGAEVVEGSQSPDEKEAAVLGFIEGSLRVMVSKVSIAGFGLNLQHCRRMVFVGLGDSYEQYFQAIRRCWRFGQTEPVTAYVVLTEPEEAIYRNVLRKEREAEAMARDLVQHVAAFERAELGHARQRDAYQPVVVMQTPAWMGAA
ncbi:MAG: helicase C-terminal domain-containing protein [Dehalococcoidia bacterium]